METLVTGIRQTDNARNQCERDIRIYFFRVRETRISIWMRCRGANAHRVTNEVQQILKYGRRLQNSHSQCCGNIHGDKGTETLTRRFAAPSPREEGQGSIWVPLPLGEGGRRPGEGLCPLSSLNSGAGLADIYEGYRNPSRATRAGGPRPSHRATQTHQTLRQIALSLGYTLPGKLCWRA